MKIEDFEIGKIYKWIPAENNKPILFKYIGNRIGRYINDNFKICDKHTLYEDGEMGCHGAWSEFTIEDKAEAL